MKGENAEQQIPCAEIALEKMSTTTTGAYSIRVAK
jgi:hypothetical protein